MYNFVYNIPVKVYFGKDQLSNLGPELSKYGKKVLITYGGGSIKKIGLYDKVVNEIKKAGLELYEVGGIEPNPRIETIRKAVELCKKEGIEVLLAIGGGSTIDSTKLIAAASKSDRDAWDFVANGAPINDALPLMSILTLSATGSEMDAGGVITNPETKDKLGFGSPHCLPKVSFLDPTNTFTVSAYQTACGSADIFSHTMETYFSMERDFYMLDGVAEVILKTVIKYAPIAIAEPDNYEARANLMWASSWAINGFLKDGSTRGWSCHPMEHELSAIYDITHGLGLAILTPRWLEYCLDETTLPMYVKYGVNVWGIDAGKPEMEIAKEAIAKTAEFLSTTLGLKSTLKEVGIDSSEFKLMAEKSCRRGNGKIEGFKILTPADVEKIYEMCL